MECFLQHNPFLVEVGQFHLVGLYKQLYKLDLFFPNFPNTKNSRVSVFRGSTELNLSSYLSSTDEVGEFVHVLWETLDRILSNTRSFSGAPNEEESANLGIVAFEVLSLQKQYGLNVAFDSSLSRIEITGFENGGLHLLALHRTAGQHFKVYKHSLPELAVMEAFKRQTTLQRHVKVFLDVLEQLEEFYHNLNTIDELCYVVLPTNIDTKTSYRVFKYNSKVFLKVSLHPLQPASVDIAFIGQTKQVTALRETYEEKQDEWDPECNVYTNLLRIFDIIAFPMRSAEQGDNCPKDNDTCGICTAYRDDDNRIPIISCDNDKCSLMFHINCLRRWFSTQRESKFFFTISIGHCPYCKHKISSSFDDMISLSA